jgi:3'-phosphoadenosine 5'-phosphosulfate (PAPS) 3'-phosphatase
MKIFGIGLSKTGTSSLAHALEILGFRVKDYPGIEHYTAGDLDAALSEEILSEFDAFTDTPIPSFFQELDKKFPGSKFILTVRERDGWLKSCKKQFTQKLADKQNEAHNSLFMDLYDSTIFDETKFAAGYDRFVDGVLQYFQDRPDDLLVLDVVGGDGWDKLCPFLERDIPVIPFPKANVTNIRWLNVPDIANIARQAGSEAFGIYSYLLPKQSISGAANIGLMRRLEYLLPKSSYRLRNDHSSPQASAAKLAHKLIEKRLIELTPNIPVASSSSSVPTPYTERQNWNHFWLVDPLSCQLSKDGRETICAVSISLIEDRTPILGVVYLPGYDITLYAMAGKGAYFTDNQKEPVLLEQMRIESDKSSFYSNTPFPPLGSIIADNTSNPILGICLRATGEHSPGFSIENSMEWQTAAAQAILAASGMRVLDSKTKEPLSYNKLGFSNDRIITD